MLFTLINAHATQTLSQISNHFPKNEVLELCETRTMADLPHRRKIGLKISLLYLE